VPKAALFDQFTVISKVLSFGIFIYELITHEQVLCPSMKNTETLNQLGTGYQMPRLANCMEGIYEIKLQTCGATPESISNHQNRHHRHKGHNRH
ncbi:unnamed protein product, partial [Hymenolepis diminuta]